MEEKNDENFEKVIKNIKITEKKGNRLGDDKQRKKKRKKEKKQKETAMANATGSRISGNMAYANNYAQSTDYTTGANGQGYNVLTAGGTESVIGSLLGVGTGMSNTLGG